MVITIKALSFAWLVAKVLPDWVQENARMCYVSRSNGETHHVLVKKIEQRLSCNLSAMWSWHWFRMVADIARHKMVLIVFEKDKKIWKRVPFKDIALLGDSVLKPLWTATAHTLA
eukprot:6433295-Amphidinium_carterae.2